VKGVALSFESLSREKGISLELLPEKECIEMYFDKDKMTKILSNILSNALKFTPPPGTVSVSITEGDMIVDIKVRDTGIGIPKNEIPRLFDRFYQVDSSVTKEYEGTGIGLALTKELVELQHGSITVESEMGLWTEVTLKFLLGRDHLRDEDVLIAEKDDKPFVPLQGEPYISDNMERDLPEETGHSLREEQDIVLVVEDNHEMREYIKGVLEREYSVVEAVNGEEGLRKAEEIIPDMIISDIMMPKLNGVELVKALKNDERTSHVPIILLTAKAGQESKLEGLEIGADDYLTKPFNGRELAARVRAILRRTQTTSEPAIIRIGQIEIDDRVAGRDPLLADKHLPFHLDQSHGPDHANQNAMGQVRLGRRPGFGCRKDKQDGEDGREHLEG